MLGDVPYSWPQANLLEGVIEEMNREPLAFVVHVGDITSGSGPCDDEWLQARKAQFGRIRAPFVLLPGDNEWVDCHRTGFEPLERLEKWRSLFCAPVALDTFVRQPGKYCEHVRWIAADHVFVGLNVPGSNNNMADPAEQAERMVAVYEWLDQAEALARERAGLVVLFQANPFLKPRDGLANGFEGILARLARLGREMPGRVVLVHGDTHRFKDDAPIGGVRRIELWGSPHIRWTRGELAPEGLRVAPGNF